VNLAIIPARGGSKRIPGKNIKLFCGKPLIAYSIEVAQRCQTFDKIIVSTDSEEVAEVAKAYGAEVPFSRPVALSDDYVGTGPVVRHAIQTCIERDFKPQFCCCIYATAPMLQAAYLKQGYEQLRAAPDKNFAFSVTSFAFPIQRAIRLKEGGVEPIQAENISKRSQDLEEAYHDAGQFYWGHCQAFLEGKPTFSTSSIPIILPRYLVQDIDTPEDWQRAELMYQAYIQGQQQSG
jgi:pseudaminic acid cytidylyltransferase